LLGARVEAAAVVSRTGRLGPRARSLERIPLEEPEEEVWHEAAQMERRMTSA